MNKFKELNKLLVDILRFLDEGFQNVSSNEAR